MNTRIALRSDKIGKRRSGKHFLLSVAQLTAVLYRPEAQVGARTRSGTRGTGLSGLHRGYFLRDNNNALCALIMHKMDE